jgi:hypothetical protein
MRGERWRFPPAVVLAGVAISVASLGAVQRPGAPASGPVGAAAPGDRIFQIDRLHRIHLTVSASEWAVLQTSQPRGGTAGGPAGSDYRAAQGRLVHVGGGFGGYFPWARADVRVEDGGRPIELKDVGLRYKGNLSFTRSSASAPLFANFKLKLDVHGTKGRWDGIKTFNLHAGVVDTSKMRDAIAYAVFRAAGVPAPRTAYAELTFSVPGVYANTSAGLFALIEDVNQTFLEREVPPGTGLLMKPEGIRGGIQNMGTSWSQYVGTYRPDRDATPREQQRVMAFAALISQPDVTRFRKEIGEYLDVERFLRFIAVNALIANTDSYLGGGHNFYLYLDPKDDKFRFIPWDQDLSMGARGLLGRGGTTTGPNLLRPFSGDQPLIYWLLDDPAVEARYRAILRELAMTVFTEAELLALVDRLEKVGSGRGPSPRDFIQQQTRYVRDLIGGWKLP